VVEVKESLLLMRVSAFNAAKASRKESVNPEKRNGVPAVAKAEGGADPKVKLEVQGRVPTMREDTVPVLAFVITSVFWGKFKPPTPTKHWSWDRVSCPKRHRRTS